MYVSVSNLHFPQMKLESEKSPEAVLEGGKFSWGSMASWKDILCMPSLTSLMEIWPDRIFLASYGPAQQVATEERTQL